MRSRIFFPGLGIVQLKNNKNLFSFPVHCRIYIMDPLFSQLSSLNSYLFWFLFLVGYYQQMCHWDHILLQPYLQGKYVSCAQWILKEFCIHNVQTMLQTSFSNLPMQQPIKQEQGLRQPWADEQVPRENIIGGRVGSENILYCWWFLLTCSYNRAYFTWYWPWWDLRVGTRVEDQSVVITGKQQK